MTHDLKLKKENVEDVLDLSPMQQGMLFHYLNSPDSEEYFEQLSLSLYGKINMDFIGEAWLHIVRKHEMLRTVFRWENLNHPIQIVLKEKSFDFQQYNLSMYEPDIKREKLEEIRAANLLNKFDIRFETFRVIVCKLDDMNHELIFSNHHIIFDGWSLGIILKDLFELYPELTNTGETSKSAGLYKRYLKSLEKQDKEEQEKYWRSYLDNLNAKSSIPHTYTLDDTLKKHQNYSFLLDESVENALIQFSKENGITPAVVFFATWGILIQRYYGTDDTLFGTAVSGRSGLSDDYMEAVGLYMNTVPLRVKYINDESNIQLLKRLHRDCQIRREFENSSLTEIKASLGVGGSGDLFDSIVIVENYPIESVLTSDTSKSLQISSYNMSETTNYELSITIAIFNGIKINITYEKHLYSNDFISNLAVYFKRILQQLISSPQMKVTDIELLLEEDYKILQKFNDTSIQYEEDLMLWEMFELQAYDKPDDIAVVCKDRYITYKGLNDKVHQLACYMKENGIGNNIVVAILMDKSIDLVVTIMAILKVGGTYLPLDPDYPEQRLEYMISNSSAEILMIDKCYADKCKNDIKKIIVTDALKKKTESAGDNKYIGSSNDLAYILYTSGSTGMPKGVPITQKSVHNFVMGMNRAIQMDGVKSILSSTTISFDIFGLELFMSLLNGLKMVLVHKEIQLDPKRVAELIYKEKIDLIQMTPSRMQSFLLHRDFKECLSNVKSILIGGEAFPQKLLENLKELTNADIYNVYGPTETTIWSTVVNLKEREKITAGTPISNTRLYILDEHRHVLPICGVGELYIGGDGVARGYINQKELTAEKFISEAIIEETKLYRTGDLARWLPTGEIQILGRLDNQVKIRGYRIEISEIEELFYQYNGINKAIVLDREDERDSSRYLVAYYETEEDISKQSLNEYLRRYLPEYMIPTQFIRMIKIPLLENGKVNRQALLSVELEQEERTEIITNETQQTLKQIWLKVLGQKDISVRDNFFNIGGNSLLLIRLYSQIDQIYPDIFKMTDFFQYPTIENQANYIDSFNNIKTINYKGLELSQQFQVNCHEKSKIVRLLLRLEEASANKLWKSSEEMKLMPEELIMIFYVYLLYNIFDKTYIPICFQLQNGLLYYGEINLEDLNSLKELGSRIQQLNCRDNEIILTQIPEKQVNEGNTIRIVISFEKSSWSRSDLLAKFDLIIWIDRSQNGLETIWEFDNGNFPKDIVVSWQRLFLELLDKHSDYLEEI